MPETKTFKVDLVSSNNPDIDFWKPHSLEIQLFDDKNVKGKFSANDYRQKTGDFTGNYTNIFLVHRTTSGPTDLRFVGYWEIVDNNLQGKAIQNVLNDHFEMFKDGTLILRKEHDNTFKNVQYTSWDVYKDTFNVLGQDFLFRFKHDSLVLKSITTSGSGEKTTQVVILKKISSDPFVRYSNSLPSDIVSGTWNYLNWAGALNDPGHAPKDYFLSIYPKTGKSGETVEHRSDISPDSMWFYKYSYAENGKNKNFNYYSGDYYKDRSEYSFYASDGIIIMANKSSGDVPQYLARAMFSSDMHFPDLWELKKKYMSYYNMHDLLTPEGVHWVECWNCHGSGKDTKTEDKTTYDQYHTYHKSETYGVTCSECNGEGGRYMDNSGRSY